MIDKTIREAEFTRQYTLSPEQFKKLLEDKIARAKEYYKAVSLKREVTASCR
jgi:tripartite-type tricarboxylate transporter receptor subunit TctC